MVKTKREFILGACFLSGAAAILSFVSLGTQEWVTSPARLTNNGEEGAVVNIGLFRGQFIQETGVIATFDLTVSCAIDLNICAMMCGDNKEDLLRKVYNGVTLTGDDCAPTLSDAKSIISLRDGTDGTTSEPHDSLDRTYLNAGAYICTVLFLIISAIAGVLSAALSIWNTVFNPYQAFLSIIGLYIYNAIAAFNVLITLILWGAMFAQDVTRNVPIYHVYTQYYFTKDLASLGYSYWLNLVSFFLYGFSICLLYLRGHLISKEPDVNVHLEDKGDPMLILY